MSGGKLRWANAANDRRKCEARAEMAESGVGASLRRIDNTNQQAWLRSISDEELATAAMRKHLASSIEWLSANPARTLARCFVERFERYAIAIRAAKRRVANGEPAWDALPPGPWKPRPWAKAARPAWMSDPSLLPKRPPGRP